MCWLKQLDGTVSDALAQYIKLSHKHLRPKHLHSQHLVNNVALHCMALQKIQVKPKLTPILKWLKPRFYSFKVLGVENFWIAAEN